MKTWKHINLEQRKIICSGISHNDEFNRLDSIIKKGINENKSIYQIKIESNDEINKSITTLYRYIYAVKYKKRKHNKKYDYSNNNIDRTGHTYLDYLSFIHENHILKI